MDKLSTWLISSRDNDLPYCVLCSFGLRDLSLSLGFFFNKLAEHGRRHPATCRLMDRPIMNWMSLHILACAGRPDLEEFTSS